MVAIIPPVYIDKPTPSLPLRYGLFQAAVGPLDFPDVHMLGGGLNFNEAMCGGGQGYAINCIDALDLKTFNTGGLNLVTLVPFVVMSNYTCALSTNFDEGFAERMAREKFFSVEQSVVESVFADGLFDQAPSLANNTPNATTVVTSAVNVADVVSELEDAIYCTSQYGPSAYLHAPIPVLNALKREHLIDFDGMRWRTPLGTVVSSGCYSGNSPAGAAPAAGTFWIYITGQTVVFRTPVSNLEQIPVEGALNRTTNQYTGLVEREYAVGYECAAYAADVTLWTP